MAQVRSLTVPHLALDIFHHPFLSEILLRPQIGTGCVMSGKNLEQLFVTCTMAQGLTYYSGISLAPDPTDKEGKTSLAPLSSWKTGWMSNTSYSSPAYLSSEFC